MKIHIVSLCLLAIAFCSISVPAQCVKCELSRDRVPTWECRGTAQGAITCTTGGQDCTVSGVCGHGGDEFEIDGGGGSRSSALCAVKSVGRVAVAQDVLDAVLKESTLFGKALALGVERKVIGSEAARIYVLDGKRQVEIGIEVLYGNKTPTIRIGRSDSAYVLDLSLARDLDFSVTDENRWIVAGWTIH